MCFTMMLTIGSWYHVKNRSRFYFCMQWHRKKVGATPYNFGAQSKEYMNTFEPCVRALGAPPPNTVTYSYTCCS